ncbi:MAG: hypothetical protein AAGI91_11235 [Bacteroidota bacterium]
MSTVLLRAVPFLFLFAALVGCDAVDDVAPASGTVASETGETAAMATPSETIRISNRYIVVLAESVSNSTGSASSKEARPFFYASYRYLHSAASGHTLGPSSFFLHQRAGRS